MPGGLVRALIARILPLVLAACAPAADDEVDDTDDTDVGDTDTEDDTDDSETDVEPGAPAAPTSVVANASSTTSVRVVWVDNADDETRFEVGVQEAGGAWAEAGEAEADALVLDVGDLTPGVAYQFRVRACADAACSAWAGPAAETTPLGAVPAAPDGLVAVTLGSRRIGLDWNDNSEDETAFAIAVSTDRGATFSEAAEVPAGTVSVDDADIASNTEFCYQVRARNAFGDSPPTNIACATTDPEGPPGAPANLRATLTGATQILLTWTNPTPNDGYDVYESVAGGAFVLAGTVTPGNLAGTYVDGLAAGTAYAYKVAARNERGPSALSTASNSVTTPAAPPLTATRFVNASVYPIVSLVVDGTELFVAEPQAIPPGGAIVLALAPGAHTWAAQTGFWWGGARDTLYVSSGSFQQASSQTGTVTVDDPSVGQLLARLSPSAYYVGEFWDELVLHSKAFRFYPNGTYTHYVDGAPAGTGTVSLVTYGGNFLLTFRLAGAVQGDAVFDERVGTFHLRNGPPSWPVLEYRWDGP